MKTQINKQLHKVLLLCICFLIGHSTFAYSDNDTRNGAALPAKGVIRVLVVFAEATGDDVPYDTWPWQAGQMPPNADQMFDPNLLFSNSDFTGQNRVSRPGITPTTPPSRPTKIWSKFYYDASFENLVVLGDYYPELIQIPRASIQDKFHATELVLANLASRGALKSKTGLKIPEDFDSWTLTRNYDYKEKINRPDGKIDNLMIIWRVNSAVSKMSNSGYTSYSTSSTLPVNIYENICCFDFLSNVIISHEFSHNLLGGNSYHTGGGEGSTRHFMTGVSGYSIIASYYHNLVSCNAWDRYNLGWKSSANVPDIHAQSLNGSTVNGDITYRIPSAAELQTSSAPTTQEYVLRDFITTGDAIRIKLPYLQEGGNTVESQWIWVENHAKDTEKMYYPKNLNQPMGIRINLQIGAEGFAPYGKSMRTNYYVPFSRFGRWDFDVVRKPILQRSLGQGIIDSLFIPEILEPISSTSNKYYTATTSSDKSNAFTGNSLLERLNYDANGDYQLQDNEFFTIQNVYKDGIQLGTDHPIFGNDYDAFQVSDVLSLATNPSTTPWLTNGSDADNTLTSLDARDNRKIYLNGLKITIKEKRADGSMVVAVTQGFYNVDKDQRWCGDIVLNEKVDLSANKKISLALGLTPIVKKNLIKINQKYYYTEPTVLTCKKNAVLSLGGNATIEVDSLCALVLQEGCFLEKAGSGYASIRIKRGGTLIMEPNVTLKGSGLSIIVEDGAYACIPQTLPRNLIFRNNSTLQGIHPYLQQTKGWACNQSKAKSGSTLATKEQNGYQSFFAHQPRYIQALDPFSYKCYEGLDIVDFVRIYNPVMVDSIYYYQLYYPKPLPNGHRYVWVRENATHDKVWVRLPWDTTGNETLVVNLNLEVGDLFPMCTSPDTIYYKVDSVYYVWSPKYYDRTQGIYDSLLLKHIRLSPITNNSWTEALEKANPLGYLIWSCGGPEMDGGLVPFQTEWSSRHLEFIEKVGCNLGFLYRRLGLTDTAWAALREDYGPIDSPSEYYDEKDGVWKTKPPMLYDFMLYADDTLYCDFYRFPNDEYGLRDNLRELIHFNDVPYTEPPTNPISNENKLNLSRYLHVSPNPAHSQTTLQWEAKAPIQGPCRISLYTLQGLEIRTFTANQWPYTLNVSDLPAGTYILRVTPTDASSAEQVVVRLIVL